MKKYNWQQPDWAQFRYKLTGFYETLQTIALKIGNINGKLSHLNSEQNIDALTEILIQEAIKTSEIEGELLSRPDVKSSIKNKLGLCQGKRPTQDKRAEGVVDMMFDVRSTYNEPLTEQKLCEWHIMLLSSSYRSELAIGTWRKHDDPMQVVSNRGGQLIVHYEAPPSKVVSREMGHFIKWFNESAPHQSQAIEFAPVRAAIAHLYFESIHPFEDGNGRIGRAIAEKALSQGFGYPLLISLSQVIESDKKAYYEALHAASLSNEITAWLGYFLDVVLKSQLEVEDCVNFILYKSHFFQKFESILNVRELKVIRRMMKSGPNGFIGGMTAKKYITISGASKATATRDLQHLVEIGAFKAFGKGRSVRYELENKF